MKLILQRMSTFLESSRIANQIVVSSSPAFCID
jgi:hypothetical protein